MNNKPLIIDTDPGIDDAVAITIALFSQEYEVKLISTVMGNVDLEKVTFNALKLTQFLKKDVKIAKGCSLPLIREYENASNVHGLTGMDGFDFPKPDFSKLEKEHSVNLMYKIIMESSEKVTLMPIAPLTNIALLFRMYPEVLDKIEKIVLMGGSYTRGNKGVYSEFNIALDPEAAKIVFESQLDITIAPMDIAFKALIKPEVSEKIKLMNKVGEMFYSLFKKYRGGSFETGLKMYDVCALAYILKPDIFKVEKYYVEVDTQSNLSAGTTYIDFKNYLKQEPNINVLTDIDEDKFINWFLESIRRCKF